MHLKHIITLYLILVDQWPIFKKYEKGLNHIHYNKKINTKVLFDNKIKKIVKIINLCEEL